MGYRPFSWGHFGAVPDPDIFECSGDFDEEVCCNCSDYMKCKKLEEEFIDDFEKLAYLEGTDE